MLFKLLNLLILALLALYYLTGIYLKCPFCVILPMRYRFPLYYNFVVTQVFIRIASRRFTAMHRDFFSKIQAKQRNEAFLFGMAIYLIVFCPLPLKFLVYGRWSLSFLSSFEYLRFHLKEVFVYV